MHRAAKRMWWSRCEIALALRSAIGVHVAAPTWPALAFAASRGTLFSGRALLHTPSSGFSLGTHGVRQGERGKATGARAGAADVEDKGGGKTENLVSVVFAGLPSSAEGFVHRAGRKPPGSSALGIKKCVEPLSALARQEPGAVLGGPVKGRRNGRGAGGAEGGNLPAHLTKFWAWARERAHVNSKVKVDWLRDQAPAASAGATVRTSAEPPPQGEQVHDAKDAAASAPQLTREFWDSLLQQRDPTKGLRKVALRSLMYTDSKGGETCPTPVDPTLWWMEEMVRIKWGGGGYLPKNLRRGDESKPVHGEKVLINHVIQVTAQAPCRLRVRWAALLHDVGKPETVEMDSSGKLTFKAHERVGAKMVGPILSAYGYDDKFCKEVATLVLRSGRIRMVERFNDQGARRLLAITGPLFEDLLDLYAADCTSARAHKHAEHQARADLLSQHVQAVLDRDRLMSLRSPLNGHDIMRFTGLRPGMRLGRLVSALRDDYLKRGPYSTSEAYQVVGQLHEQLNSKISPVNSDSYIYRYKQRAKRADMVGRTGEAASAGRKLIWKPLQVSHTAEEDVKERKEVLVFRLRLDQQRSSAAQQMEYSVGKAMFEDGEVFRDVAVRRDTSLYTLAKIVTHAFDFDFDDDFAFYRRRRGLECPGAEAAYSGIPAAARRGEPSNLSTFTPSPVADNAGTLINVKDEYDAKNCLLTSLGVEPQASEGLHEDPLLQASERKHEAPLQASEGQHEEPLLEHDFELLARASGGVLRYLNGDGFAFRFDTQYGPDGTSKQPMGWRPDDDDDDLLDESFLRREDDREAEAEGSGEEASFDCAESLSSAGVESLSYPLRLPQWGPASLIHTLVGNLFDRSRRSLVFALYNGGPWYIRVDFVEARERKQYETSLPCVTARLGYARRHHALAKTVCRIDSQS